MYHLIVGHGEVPVPLYTVVALPAVGTSPPTTGSKTDDSHSATDDYLELSLLSWCFLILISGIIAFATTLFVFVFLDSGKTDTTTALEAQQGLSYGSWTTSPRGPYIYNWVTAAPNASATI
ncbi:uncharacterized protein LOC125945880 [Dermacentor silvarum]|uniref:uncharacterized protein LOC125945880 n=1 Tax=Dermacentor silvarum TaxID=543639 RepID=UPI002101D0FD|nr:uncharacterized protein LOC125945880 [Dermacentor silvarum]